MRGISPMIATVILLLIVITIGVAVWYYSTNAVHAANTVNLQATGSANPRNPFPKGGSYVYEYTVTLTINNQYGQTLYIKSINMTLYGNGGTIGVLSVVNLSTTSVASLPHNQTLTLGTQSFTVIINKANNIVPSGRTTTFSIIIDSPVPLTEIRPSMVLVAPDGHTIPLTAKPVTF